MAAVESSIVARIANSVGSRLMRDRLLVLCYHGVLDGPNFEAQMRELVIHRDPVTLEDLAESVRTGDPLGPGSVLVTFDDGDRTVLDTGLPILVRLAIPAAMFVITDLIGTDEPFWWDELADLVAAGGVTSVADGDGPSMFRALKRVPEAQRRRALAELRGSATAPAPRRAQLEPGDLRLLEQGGVSVGSHSSTHPFLDRCPSADLESEVADSRRRLEELLGHRVTAFAYPNGNVNGAVRQASRMAGYDLAFGWDHRFAGNPPSDPLCISRVRVDDWTGLDRFRLLISGAHSFAHRVRGRS